MGAISKIFGSRLTGTGQAPKIQKSSFVYNPMKINQGLLHTLSSLDKTAGISPEVADLGAGRLLGAPILGAGFDSNVYFRKFGC